MLGIMCSVYCWIISLSSLLKRYLHFHWYREKYSSLIENGKMVEMLSFCLFVHSNDSFMTQYKMFIFILFFANIFGVCVKLPFYFRLAVPTQNPTELPMDSKFIIAMATCHSLTIIDNELTGDPLDLKMFQSINWVRKLSVDKRLIYIIKWLSGYILSYA